MASRQFGRTVSSRTTLAEFSRSGVAAGMHRLNWEPSFTRFLTIERSVLTRVMSHAFEIFRRIVIKRTDDLTIPRLGVTLARHQKLKVPVADPAKTCLGVL